jgi:hypothetical protein
MPEVKTPFPDIAVHIIQPKAIGGKTPDRGRLFTIITLGTLTIGMVAIIVGYVSRYEFPKGERCRRSRTAGIFPFRFTGKPIVPSRRLREALAKLYRFIPIDSFNWTGFPLEL